MNRHERHGAILRLVRERSLSTQADLVAALHDAGHTAVQTTISRDIHDLGLVKIRNDEGRLVYAPPGADPGRHDRSRRRSRAGRSPASRAATCSSWRRRPAIASPLAQAIDESAHPSIAGTIAGENTVLLVAREPATGHTLAATSDRTC